MENKPLLNIKSLKEQVYEYLREQMRKGDILPGPRSTWKRLPQNWE